jgi:hypothetical protein
MIQAVEYLLCKPGTLSSNPIPTSLPPHPPKKRRGGNENSSINLLNKILEMCAGNRPDVLLSLA